MKHRYFLVNFLIIFIVVRSLLVWYGFDRLPRLSNNDEVIQNDAAVAMSKGFGLVAKSYDGVMDLGKIFGHHPPVFPLLQSAIFRLFGFSALTLRASDIVFFILYSVFFVMLLYRLKNMGVYDNFAFFWAAFIFTSDPTSFNYARLGRPDSLAIFFGIAAFLCIVSNSGVSTSKKMWMIGAILIGLSISTHLEMVTFWVMYIIAATIQFYRGDKKYMVALFLVPIIVFVLVWIAAHGMRSLEALSQFHHMEAWVRQNDPKHLSGLEANPIVTAMLSASPRLFMQNGGFALILVLLS